MNEDQVNDLPDFFKYIREHESHIFVRSVINGSVHTMSLRECDDLVWGTYVTKFMHNWLEERQLPVYVKETV